MNNEINTRIIELRKALSLTQSQFAEKIGLKFSAVSMIELGKTTLTEANIKLICHVYNISEQWLRTGEGEIFIPSTSAKEKRLLEIFRALSPTAQDLLIEYGEKLLNDENIIFKNLQHDEKTASKKSGSA